MKITITKEDVDNCKSYNSITGCALAKVMQKALNDPSIYVFTMSIYSGNTVECIGEINPKFRWKDYDDIKQGFTSEFITEYTPIIQ